jgi:hypothetical protein
MLTPPGKLAADKRAILARITARCEETKSHPCLGPRVSGHVLPPPRRAAAAVSPDGPGLVAFSCHGRAQGSPKLAKD